MEWISGLAHLENGNPDFFPFVLLLVERTNHHLLACPIVIDSDSGNAFGIALDVDLLRSLGLNKRKWFRARPGEHRTL